MSLKLKATLFVFSFFVVCPFLSLGEAVEEKPAGQVLVRVFHTGNMAGKVSPCPT